jgi:hypothetical protein
MESSYAASFGYPCNMKSKDDPELFPQEEVYLKVPNVTIIDQK